MCVTEVIAVRFFQAVATFPFYATILVECPIIKDPSTQPSVKRVSAAARKVNIFSKKKEKKGKKKFQKKTKKIEIHRLRDQGNEEKARVLVFGVALFFFCFFS
jgi:hypothetical protein